MVAFSLDQSARLRLAAMRGVCVIADPSPRNPSVIVMVMAGTRCIDIRRDGDAFCAQAHLRLGEWLPLAEGVSEDTAFAAVLAFLSLVGNVPQFYAPEHDTAERAAAAEVFAAFTSQFSLAA